MLFAISLSLILLPAQSHGIATKKPYRLNFLAEKEIEFHGGRFFTLIQGQDIVFWYDSESNSGKIKVNSTTYKLTATAPFKLGYVVGSQIVESWTGENIKVTLEYILTKKTEYTGDFYKGSMTVVCHGQQQVFKVKGGNAYY